MKNPITVLIIDDDKNFADTTNDILLEKGFESEYVLSGVNGVEKVKQKQYEFILLDMKMPVLNGLETYRKIKAISPNSTVIMCTAFSMDEMIEQSLKEGVYSILRKPLDIGRTLQLIKQEDIGGTLVMVADDDANTRETIKDNLIQYGYQVSVAVDGEDAIKLAQEKEHDVLFIDVKIPPVNGLDVYLRIKQIKPNAKVVMITAHKQELEDVVRSALDEGAYACLEKPFGVNNMVTVIEQIASNKEKRRTESTVRNITVLLIDDEQNMLSVLSDLFEQHGFYTVTALTAEDGLQKALDKRPDVVVSDINLAGNDGYKLCESIKAIPNLEVKIVGYSGDSNIVDAQLSKQQQLHGIDSFVIKTEGFTKILDAVKELI